MINSNSTTLRISGLASGMNTDEIVANLVNVQSSRLHKMQQSKISMGWKSDAYRDVNKKVDEFRKAMEGLRLQSTFNKQTVSSSDPNVAVSSAGISSKSEIIINSATLATADKPAIVSFNTQGKDIAEQFSFTLNNSDTAIVVPKGTLDQAVAAINKLSDKTLVKAANVGGSLVLTSTGTGPEAEIRVSNITGLDPWGMATTLSTPKTGEAGKSGAVTINGTPIMISTNTFTYEGVTINLKNDISKNVTVQIGSDTEGIFTGIKTFVDKYNELIADLNGRLSEKKYRDYPPLLDEQRKDMKENETKLWDEKAKSGLLTGDSTIRSFLTEMRNSLNSAIEGMPDGFKSLRDIGINFSTNYRDNGKLILDEAKLKGVLQTNLVDVKNMFAAKDPDLTGTTVTNSTLHQKSGFAWRIYDRLNTTVLQMGSLAGSPNSTVDTKSFIGKQLKTLDQNIVREQDKVHAYENRLWKQFSAMEKALQQMNSQSSWLSSQLGM
ncbi:flagellar filament capping protein FliD [Bacillus sp. EB01]|uniref:flagellar filament capping protein FliD n=1 Tax=Bacillus sp. EB01 TaxID=1347086 RepID=UPI0005C5E41A|nr:flagellar filament capping protein FliD [Bacillus sp. EB01]